MRAHFIVTSNLRDFPSESLVEWGVEAMHPDEFLLRLYESDPATVLSKLNRQAADIGRNLHQVLNTLRAGVPKFAARVLSDAHTELG